MANDDSRELGLGRRLPAAVFAEICALGHPRSLPAGTAIFWEGDPAGPVFAITQGRVKLFRTTVDGHEILLDHRGPCHVIGEMSALDGRPRSASAITTEATEVVVVPAAHFASLADQRTELALPLLRVVTSQLRAANDAKTAWRNPDTVARVASQLVALADSEPPAGGATIALMVNHEELAGWVGLNRETVTRALGRLRAEHLVETQRGRVIVTDLPALRRRAGLG